MIYKFTVERENVTYQCEREVTGKGVLKQTIYVHGSGSKADSGVYGASRHSASLMADAARRIALEILSDV